MLDRAPGSAVVHNLITSRAVPEIILERGGRPVRTRVGHSYIKQVMAETGAIFGGEHSGHYYFRENYRADSGMLAMLVLLRVLTEAKRPLSDLRTEVERYHASGEINFTVADPAASIADIENAFAAAPRDELDGLTVDLGDAWFNVRPSNTEPLLRLNVEATEEEGVAEVVSKIEELLKE
jgi:phosphomannomutase